MDKKLRFNIPMTKMDKKLRFNISMTKKVNELGKKQSNSKGLNFSAYITTLIVNDAKKDRENDKTND